MAALLWYFVLAFAISWSGALVAARVGSVYAIFVAMLPGPTLACVAVTATQGGARGLRELGGRLLEWRVDARWYATLLLAPLLLLIVLGALSAASPEFLPGVLIGGSPWDAVLYAAIAGFGAGIFEELGWTGFATPRLLHRFGWLRAGVVLGLPWALWHMLPDYLGRETYGWIWLLHALQWLVALTAFRAYMTWVYSHTHSLLLGILLHVSYTGSQAFFWPAAASLGVELIWFGAFALSLWIAVAFVKGSERGTAAPSGVANAPTIHSDGGRAQRGRA